MGKMSGQNNQGIMHAVFKFGQTPLCGSKRALMATEVSAFREWDLPCKRCTAKLAEIDARAERKAKAETVADHPKGSPTIIDMTPTWLGVLPLFLAALESGTPEARYSATAELRRMASLADLYAESIKSKKSAA